MKKGMNLSKFLTRFCNITGKDLSQLHHEDVYWLFPNLKRATFKKIEENPELVATGQIIIVDDGKTLVPYYAPKILYDQLSEPTEFVLKDKKTGSMVDYSKHDVIRMNEYELRLMLRKKFNSIANQRQARRELEDRGVVLSKKYNRTEEKRRVERIKNEGY